MAECTVVRCSQERRFFRKELQKWSKEILYIIGLERLAEELMGSRKWKIFAQHFTELDNKIPDDWSPEETCYLCDAKKLPPYDPASGIIPVDGINPLVIETDEHSVSSDHVDAAGSYVSCSPVLSPCNNTALSKYISSSPYVHDEPLDLSINALHRYPDVKSLMYGTLINNSTLLAEDIEMCINQVLKIPQISMKSGHKKRVYGNSKRSYTEKELQAALRDIQSGKLGTRRAAVIYGIPRSTLRNKVYKLANESRGRSHILHNSDSIVFGHKGLQLDFDSDIKTDSITKQNNISASESLRKLLKHTITQKALGFQRLSSIKSNIDTSKNSLSSSTESIQKHKMMECNEVFTPVLSCMLSNIHEIALSKCKTFYSSCPTALRNDLTLPILPELIRYLAEERIAIEKERIKECDLISNEMTSHFQDFDSSESCSNVILKVPSFKPAKSSTITDTEFILSDSLEASSSRTSSRNKGEAASLKELMSCSASQKMGLSQKPIKFPSILKLKKVENPSTPDSLNLFPQNKDMNLIMNSLNAPESSKSGKQTRAKRGRYRNYNRDNLACAVKAVQKGEMSVHRAGTVYGVPHSTLEYKVKERHLLRPRKRELFNHSPVTDTSDALMESSCDSSRMNYNMDVQKLSTECNSSASVDALSTHISLWQSMPCFSLEFPQLNSNNFFASQMMQKLHENISYQESQKLKHSENI